MFRPTKAFSVLGLLVLGLPAAAARAEEPTAPVPGEESGRIDAHDEDDSVAREVGRGLLFLPRAAFELAFAPLRAGIWAYERFQLRDRWFAVFFDDARNVGLYPTVAYDSYTGVLVGGRFVVRDLFGAHEHAAVRTATGGDGRDVVTGAIRSGERFGRLHLELAAEHDRHPRRHYYGIGNASDTDLTYREQLQRVSALVDVRLVRELHVRTAGALTSLAFTADDAMLSDVRHAYGELELAWDSRGRYTRYEPGSLATVGWLVSLYGGRLAVENGPDFWRGGAELQHFLRITTGPRVIATRLHVEAIGGGDVPFHELATLGGKARLRGYPTDRFRDHAAALATAEYRWDLARWLVASTFVDVGRVAPHVDELADGAYHVGYGLGIDFYTERSFLIRTSLASSIDGGLFFTVAFDPAFELDPRVER